MLCIAGPLDGIHTLRRPILFSLFCRGWPTQVRFWLEWGRFSLVLAMHHDCEEYALQNWKQGEARQRESRCYANMPDRSRVSKNNYGLRSLPFTCPDGHADRHSVWSGVYFVRFSFHGLLSTGVPRNLSAAASSPMTDISNAVCPAPLNAKAFSRS